jgi:hypothetical protein
MPLPVALRFPCRAALLVLQQFDGELVVWRVGELFFALVQVADSVCPVAPPHRLRLVLAGACEVFEPIVLPVVRRTRLRLL